MLKQVENVNIKSMNGFRAIQETPIFIGKWACSSAVRAGTQFKKEFLRAFSLRCAAWLTLGISIVRHSHGVAQNCAVLQQKIRRP
jgi:hypothetical protein